MTLHFQIALLKAVKRSTEDAVSLASTQSSHTCKIRRATSECCLLIPAQLSKPPHRCNWLENVTLWPWVPHPAIVYWTSFQAGPRQFGLAVAPPSSMCSTPEPLYTHKHTLDWRDLFSYICGQRRHHRPHCKQRWVVTSKPRCWLLFFDKRRQIHTSLSTSEELRWCKWKVLG